MKQHYLVRYGWQREIGKVTLSDNQLIQAESLLSVRGQRVVVDCGRGLEVGECLGRCSADAAISTGKLYRLMAPEDELLVGQLDLLAKRAFDRCVDWLAKIKLQQVLLEVEPLMDGKTLVFHFLNDPDELLQEHLDRLVAMYEQEVRQSEFAQRVEAGCGPHCGTAKSSCQSSCSSCKMRGCSIQKTAQTSLKV
jgi:hypothetical protein